MSAATKTTAKTTTTAQAPKAGAAKRKVVTLEGTVESDKRAKTRTVVVRFQSKHAKYGKYMRKQTVIQAHDEKNTSKLGDTVEIGPCRPMSKTKNWTVLRVVKVKVGE